MTSDSSRRSPIGYARLTAVDSALPPVRSKMRWKANVAHSADGAQTGHDAVEPVRA